MSGSKSVSSAKMRGGGTRPAAPNKTASFSNNIEDSANSNLVQVTPIQMLKIHEARITNIESANKLRSVEAPKMETIYEEQASSKQTITDLQKTIQELKATIATLQTSVLFTTQTFSKLRDELDVLKKEMLDIAKVPLV
jgi:predicted RNase H-like nuclease (RuvC/YqgF family)